MLMGCVGNELSRAWLVDRTRILGVQAEPAEAAPGDRVEFRSLSVDPAAGGISTVSWLGCLIEDSSDSYGCSPDFERIEELLAIDVDSLPPQQQLQWFQDLQAAGVLGFEPDLPPSLNVPEDLLDDLSEEKKLEGKNYILTITALPEGLELEDPEALTDEAVGEVALKRLPVSVAETPNHNPVITAVLLENEHELLDGDTLTLSHGQTYLFEPLLSEDSIEDYVYINSDGEREERTEEPYFSFYLTGGSFDQSIALHPFLDFEWTAPVDPPEDPVQMWMVVRDRRGGMAWSSLTIVVE